MLRLYMSNILIAKIYHRIIRHINPKKVNEFLFNTTNYHFSRSDSCNDSQETLNRLLSHPEFPFSQRDQHTTRAMFRQLFQRGRYYISLLQKRYKKLQKLLYT